MEDQQNQNNSTNKKEPSSSYGDGGKNISPNNTPQALIQKESAGTEEDKSQYRGTEIKKPFKRKRKIQSKDENVEAKSNIAIAITNIFMALIAFIGIGLTYWQAREANRTTDSTFMRMDKEIKAFTIIAKNDSILSENTKKYVAISDSSYQATQKNNRAILKIQDSAFRVENRAYISMPEETLVFNSDSSEGIITLTIQNVGKTDAKKIRILEHSGGPVISQPVFSFSKSDTNNYSIIYPNQKQVIRQLFYVLKSHKNELIMGIRHIFIYGRITYEDVFHVHHYLNFMQRYDMDFEIFNFCGKPEDNDGD